MQRPHSSLADAASTRRLWGVPTTLPRFSNRLRAGRESGTAGLSLVEVLVAVLIISLLAMLAVPTVQRIQRKAKATVILNDLRVFAAAFDTYAHQNGRWPAECAAGVLPPEMTNDLKADVWLRTTPMGGKYNWDNNQLHFGTRFQAAIAISSTGSAPMVLDVPMLLELEHAIDGPDQTNFLGGTFRIGTGLCPLYIVQP